MVNVVGNIASIRSGNTRGDVRAEDRPNGGRLARPVGTEKAEDLTARYRQGEVVDGDNTAEPLGQIVAMNGEFGCTARGRRRGSGHGAFQQSGN